MSVEYIQNKCSGWSRIFVREERLNKAFAPECDKFFGMN